MNIYDEALESIDKLEVSKEYLFEPVLETIIQALERAKKEHELLGLYRNLSMETDVFERSKYWEQINKIELEELK